MRGGEKVNMETVIIAFIGLLTGITMAVFLPYMRKIWQGTMEASDWSNRYILVILSGFVMSLMTAFVLAPQVLVMEVLEDQVVTGVFGVFLLNFSVGFGQTGLIKEIFDFGKTTSTTTTTAKPPG